MMPEGTGLGPRLAAALLVGWAGLSAPGTAGADQPAPTYVFAVVPQAPPVVMSGLWSPIVERISRETGVQLQVKLYEGIEAFDADLAAGVPDFAYVHPEQATRAHRAAGYRPLVRNQEAIRAVLFVERGSPYRSLFSLAGAEVALIGPRSFCSITLRRELRGLGIVPRYVGTAANAYKQVVVGLAPAGGVLDYTLGGASPDVREKLRVIYESPPLAPHPVIANPRVPRALADRIAGSFLALPRTEEGSRLLKKVHMDAPIGADYERDYAPLERVLGDASAGRPAGRER